MNVDRLHSFVSKEFLKCDRFGRLHNKLIKRCTSYILFFKCIKCPTDLPVSN